MITDEMVDRAFKCFTDALNEYTPCTRCQGLGYHHGFGENGHDPDWCESCGGGSVMPKYDDRSAMRLALEAAFPIG